MSQHLCFLQNPGWAVLRPSEHALRSTIGLTFEDSTPSDVAIECVVPLMRRLFDLNHVGFIPFALAEALHANQVNTFPSLLFYEADALVLYVFYSVAHLEFWITHTFSLGHLQKWRTG